jgi:GNAT superfamily N-acetyltransferase
MTLPELEVTTDLARMDVDFVHRHLRNSYWASDRPREVIERSMQNSLCFGAFRGNQQVAFGRAITDRAVFAYLADVFVIPECRGQGIGKALIDAVVKHPDLRGVPLMFLRTRDAHGLYSQFGFEPLRKPEDMMGRYAGG